MSEHARILVCAVLLGGIAVVVIGLLGKPADVAAIAIIKQHEARK